MVVCGNLTISYSPDGAILVHLLSNRTSVHTQGIFSTFFIKMQGDNGFKPFPHFSTKALHEGQEPEQWKSMAVVPPISMSSTFKQKAPGEHSVSTLHGDVMISLII